MSRSPLLRFLVFSLFCVALVHSHGAMTTPTSRGIAARTKSTSDEQAPCPCPGNVCGPEFVCRGDPAESTLIPLTAGAAFTPMRWTLNAAHNGDCFVYLTYDVDAAPTAMRWFKIAQWFDCKSLKDTDVSFTIPSYLPAAAHVIVRWEWYALHVRDGGIIEFYSQCFDASMAAGPNSGTVLPTPQVTIPGHLPTAATAYRDSFNPSTPQFITGPPIASLNGSSYSVTQTQGVPSSTSTSTSTSGGTTPSTPPPVTPSPVTPSPVTPSPVTPSPVTPSPVTPSPVTPSPVTPGDGSNVGTVSSSNSGRTNCTVNEDCDSGICQIDHTCYVSKDSGLGAGGVAAIVFAGLLVIIVGATVGFFALNRKEIPYMAPWKGRV